MSHSIQYTTISTTFREPRTLFEEKCLAGDYDAVKSLLETGQFKCHDSISENDFLSNTFAQRFDVITQKPTFEVERFNFDRLEWLLELRNKYILAGPGDDICIINDVVGHINSFINCLWETAWVVITKKICFGSWDESINYRRLLDLFVEYNEQWTVHAGRALNSACEIGSLEFVKYLLERDAPTCYFQFTHLAVRDKSFDRSIFFLFLEKSDVDVIYAILDSFIKSSNNEIELFKITFEKTEHRFKRHALEHRHVHALMVAALKKNKVEELKFMIEKGFGNNFLFPNLMTLAQRNEYANSVDVLRYLQEMKKLENVSA
jgi:hypothetical protein